MGGGSSKATPGLCGLKNFGNTCYMNSSIQCLSHTGLLTALVLQSNATAAATGKGDTGLFPRGTVAGEYVQLLRQLWSGANARLSPSELKTAIDKHDTK
jgi:ubiquitin C-terminal hydrolase